MPATLSMCVMWKMKESAGGAAGEVGVIRARDPSAR